jgi:hypothetical protein
MKGSASAVQPRNVYGPFRAALNSAFQAGKIFPASMVCGLIICRLRNQFVSLTPANPEFRPIAQAGLLTGGRYGSIAKLTVADFDLMQAPCGSRPGTEGQAQDLPLPSNLGRRGLF